MTTQPAAWRSRWNALAYRPMPDRLQNRLYPLLFYTLVALAGIDLLGLIVTFALHPSAGWTTTQTLYAMIVTLSAAAWFLAIRGMFRAAVILTAVGLLAIQAFGLFAVGLVAGAILLPSMMTAIVFAGLMLSWRPAVVVSVGAVTVVGLIAAFGNRAIPAAILANTDAATESNAFVFGCLVAFVMIIVMVFRRALEKELRETVARETEVRAARDSLQHEVEARTADLSTALAESTSRAEQLAQTLAALERSEALVQQMNIPLIPVSAGVLLAPMIGALGRERMETASVRILETLNATRNRTLILDLTSVSVLDGDDTQAIMRIARSAQLMGVEVVLVGIGPEVAQHIVALQLPLELATYATLEQAIVRIMERRVARRPVMKVAA